jgi:ABC-type transport system substrate-binding protein
LTEGGTTGIGQTGGKALARNPVGTGPFKFVEWVENDHITMVRFPDYFEKGLSYLDRVEVKLMTEASSAVAAIKQQGE